MLTGLSLFAERFASFPDSYIVIGGTACYLNLQEEGLVFRATKDIDIVITVEALKPAFFDAFWDFVHEGNYTIKQRNDGKPLFYRFSKPANREFPAMLELFSRSPFPESKTHVGQLTPLPSGSETSSLSAILLDDEYYEFLHDGTVRLQGISIARPEYLIPLKAKAWLDLSDRRSKGEQVDFRNISKHLKDISVLFSILDPMGRLNLPEHIASDMQEFIERTSPKRGEKETIGEALHSFYQLSSFEAPSHAID